MWKRVWCNGAIGMAIGVAFNELIALVTSYALNMGYFMPCLASLPEQVGGELNAVTLQMVLCGLLGMGIGMAADKAAEMEAAHPCIMRPQQPGPGRIAGNGTGCCCPWITKKEE